MPSAKAFLDPIGESIDYFVQTWGSPHTKHLHLAGRNRSVVSPRLLIVESSYLSYA